MRDAGAAITGGCFGTTPEHLAVLSALAARDASNGGPELRGMMAGVMRPAGSGRA